MRKKDRIYKIAMASNGDRGACTIYEISGITNPHGNEKGRSVTCFYSRGDEMSFANIIRDYFAKKRRREIDWWAIGFIVVVIFFACALVVVLGAFK